MAKKEVSKKLQNLAARLAKQSSAMQWDIELLSVELRKESIEPGTIVSLSTELWQRLGTIHKEVSGQPDTTT